MSPFRESSASTAYLLNQTSQAIRLRIEQALRDLSVTGIQYTVLSILDARPGQSSADLSRQFFVTPQTMNEIIVGLERRGLIARVEDPANRRILRMNLSEQGQCLLARCKTIADQVERTALEWVSPDAHDQLRFLLRMVLDGFRERDNGRPERFGIKKAG